MLKLGFLFLTLFSLGIHAQFECSEHAIAGDDIILPSFTGKLNLKNGLKMTFGELIAMGDFYGIVNTPISEAENQEGRKERFLNAFNLLATKPEAVSEASSIVSAIRCPKNTDETPRQRAQKWNCLTGGGCSNLAWWTSPGRYLLLAKKNYDHFGDNAISAYIAGHEAALEEAAHGVLEKAYAMDAFACHFLTDHFASGHIRTPRIELPKHVTPAVVGSLLSGFMHNEECALGLHVHNPRGDHWVAYGDGRYLDPLNQDNRRMMKQAIQASVDDVYEAYVTGQNPANYTALSLIPQADDHGPEGRTDIAPMFYWDAAGKRLMRRNHLSDPYDYTWSPHWLGWSTLAELQALKVFSSSEIDLDMFMEMD
ncbi:MAG: hypothetical protein WCK42_00085 [Myxococcaceae bacterium]